MKVGTLYLYIGHIIPSTLIISEKNECLRIVVANEQGEQIVAVNFDIVLWHNKLGHVSEKGMKVLHAKKFLSGLNYVNIDLCEIFVCEKQKRVSFVKSGKENKEEERN